MRRRTGRRVAAVAAPIALLLVPVPGAVRAAPAAAAAHAPAAATETTGCVPATTGAAPASCALPEGAATSTTGPVAVPGFDGSAITIGVVDPPAAGTSDADVAGPVVRAAAAGFDAFVASVNAGGGVRGKHRVRVLRAEAADGRAAATRVAELERRVVLFGRIAGSAPLAASLPHLRRAGLVAAPLSLDAAWARDPNVLPVGGTHQAQAMNVVDWWDGSHRGARVCAVAVRNRTGDAALEGFDAARAALRLDAPAAGRIRVAATDVNMAAVAVELDRLRCRAVLAATTPAQTTGLLVFGAQAGYAPTVLAVAAAFDPAQLTDRTEALYARQVFVAVDAAPWGDRSAPGMARVEADAKALAPRGASVVTAGFVWGHVQAQVVVALLEHAAERGDLSRAGIRDALTSLGTVGLGGVYPEWGYGPPAQRVPPAATNVMAVARARPDGLKAAPGGRGHEAAFARAYAHPCWAAGRSARCP